MNRRDRIVAEVRAQMAQSAAFLKVLKDGCSRCDRDEAEGGLVDHCTKCQHEISTLAYEIFITQQRRIR